MEIDCEVCRSFSHALLANCSRVENLCRVGRFLHGVFRPCKKQDLWYFTFDKLCQSGSVQICIKIQIFEGLHLLF